MPNILKYQKYYHQQQQKTFKRYFCFVLQVALKMYTKMSLYKSSSNICVTTLLNRVPEAPKIVGKFLCMYRWRIFFWINGPYNLQLLLEGSKFN